MMKWLLMLIVLLLLFITVGVFQAVSELRQIRQSFDSLRGEIPMGH